MKYVGELRRKQKKKNESNQLRVSVSGARASNTGPSALICPVDKSANKQKKLSLSLSLRRVSVSFTIGKKIEEKQGIDGGKKRASQSTITNISTSPAGPKWPSVKRSVVERKYLLRQYNELKELMHCT